MSAAKDAYNAFHTAMGSKDALPFERLAQREQDAWQEVVSQRYGTYEWVRELESRLNNAVHEIRELTAKLAAKPKPRKKTVKENQTT